MIRADISHQSKLAGMRIESDHVHKLLHNDSAMSFNTDIWSLDVSPTSMLSLTAQWIDCDFKLKVLLHSQEFTSSHTSLAISQAFTDMLDKWIIDRSTVHAVVCDITRNMAKAMTDSDIMSLPCLAHSLQLAVNEGILHLLSHLLRSSGH